MKKVSDETVEIIRFKERGAFSYHIKPENPESQFYDSARVPKELFDMYISARSAYHSVRSEIYQYFSPLKDKPTRVEKNHVVREGEVVKFDWDWRRNITMWPLR